MNNAASFDLLQFVERRPSLSFKKIMSIFVLISLLLMSYFSFQLIKFHHASDEVASTQQSLDRAIYSLRPLLQQGDTNPLVAVLTSNPTKNTTGFYPEFSALTHIQVQGLWLNRVLIQRNPPLIKIMGAMTSPDKLNQLLQQLSAQPVFRDVHFVGVAVDKGLLPNVPEKYKKDLTQLKIPPFYHFIIQTNPLDETGGTYDK